ncbi:unnamed protein product, partial [marine sediment metagenome]
ILSRDLRRREVERIARKIRRRAEEAPEARGWYPEARAWAATVAPDGPDLLLDMLAATSARAGIRGNLRAAFRAYRLASRGLPTAWGAPYGVPFNTSSVARVAAGLPLTGAKVGPFAAALRGDPAAVAIDVWMARAAGYRDGPTERERSLVEEGVRVAARRLGWSPAETQAACWAAERRAAGRTASESYAQAWASIESDATA